jgi:GNAT superfamily N-acetyltransferase
MFPIRWLTELESLYTLGAQEGWLGDNHEQSLFRHASPYLAFGAFDGLRCVGTIAGYVHEKSAWISHFVVAPEYRNQGVGRRLFEHLLAILEVESDTLFLHAAPAMVPFYRAYGFCTSQTITRHYRAPQVPAFHFHPSQKFKPSKLSLALHAHDVHAFQEKRNMFLAHALNHTSSLIFCTASGYLHSRMMEKTYLFLGPWVMKSAEEAEEFLKALLFFRGNKPIYADAPDVDGTNALYARYEFIAKSTTVQMQKGETLSLEHGSIFAYGSTGVCG